MILYIPSFYGDIQLKPEGDDKTVLVAERLTAAEKDALLKLSVEAYKKGWTAKDSSGTGFDLSGEGAHLLTAPLDKIQKRLVKLLKPGRKIITAVKFANGSMEEVHSTSESVVAEVLPKARAAVSVAAPTRGCPEPDFVKAEIKARGVLEVFLNEDQLADFRRHNRFITRGASGCRYMITSRHARDSLARYHRTLYDLDAEIPLCVHDYSVPAAEEMLALHVLVQLPGCEQYVRHLET